MSENEDVELVLMDADERMSKSIEVLRQEACATRSRGWLEHRVRAEVHASQTHACP